MISLLPPIPVEPVALEAGQPVSVPGQAHEQPSKGIQFGTVFSFTLVNANPQLNTQDALEFIEEQSEGVIPLETPPEEEKNPLVLVVDDLAIALPSEKSSGVLQSSIQKNGHLQGGGKTQHPFSTTILPALQGQSGQTGWPLTGGPIDLSPESIQVQSRPPLLPQSEGPSVLTDFAIEEPPALQLNDGDFLVHRPRGPGGAKDPGVEAFNHTLVKSVNGSSDTDLPQDILEPVVTGRPNLPGGPTILPRIVKPEAGWQGEGPQGFSEAGGKILTESHLEGDNQHQAPLGQQGQQSQQGGGQTSLGDGRTTGQSGNVPHPVPSESSTNSFSTMNNEVQHVRGQAPVIDRPGIVNPLPPHRLQLDVTLSDMSRVQIDVAVQHRQVSANLLMDQMLLRNLVLQNQPQLEMQLSSMGLELKQFGAEVSDQSPFTGDGTEDPQAEGRVTDGEHEEVTEHSEPRLINDPLWERGIHVVA